MKKTNNQHEAMYGSREKPVPQDHWEIRTGLLKGNNRNPYEVYFAKTAPEWPKTQKPINECDY